MDSCAADDGLYRRRKDVIMKRRPLDFRSEDEVIAELERLERGGYVRAGNWGLGEICQHLCIFIRGSLDGFTGPHPPWYIRMLAPLFVRRMLKTRRMPEGVKIPAQFRPHPPCDDKAEVEELKQLLIRFRDHSGPLHPSPFGGDLGRDRCRQMHLIHCAHHLSFLHPAQAATR
jgi:hypothetical protein